MENNIIDPKTLKVQSELPRIEFENQNQLEKTVDAMVERFTGLVVTKDTYKPSKEVRAEINKVIKTIDRQRIDKVNEVKKPIDDFNDRTKACFIPTFTLCYCAQLINISSALVYDDILATVEYNFSVISCDA